jgi:hypothetical protein
MSAAPGINPRPASGPIVLMSHGSLESPLVINLRVLLANDANKSDKIAPTGQQIKGSLIQPLPAIHRQNLSGAMGSNSQ